MDEELFHFPKWQHSTGCDLALVNLWRKLFAILQFVPTQHKQADFGICTPAVTGTLKGYDQLLNLVLDEAIEFERGTTQTCCIV
jgi:hypothetical protein